MVWGGAFCPPGEGLLYHRIWYLVICMTYHITICMVGGCRVWHIMGGVRYQPA